MLRCYGAMLRCYALFDHSIVPSLHRHRVSVSTRKESWEFDAFMPARSALKPTRDGDEAMVRCYAKKRDGDEATLPCYGQKAHSIVTSQHSIVTSLHRHRVFEHSIVPSLHRHRVWLRTRWSFSAIINTQ